MHAISTRGAALARAKRSARSPAAAVLATGSTGAARSAVAAPPATTAPWRTVVLETSLSMPFARIAFATACL
jgi:hypothetical protein